MSNTLTRLTAAGLCLLAACAQTPSVDSATLAVSGPEQAPDVLRGELVIERVTTAVPWPRGVRFVDGKLYAVARGVHRSAGGPQADIEDRAGTIFQIDPDVFEPADADQPVSAAVRQNGRAIAEPTAPPFNVWDGRMPATLDTKADRPYCMLVWDDITQNFFVCAYSGIDLPTTEKFRKNATDAVYRFDTRTGQWLTVEAHDPSVVPVEELGTNVDSRYYPHHDIDENPAPHGLVNGACGAEVVGRYLYVGAKDNSALAQYDLSAIRADPNAPAPPGRYIFEGSKGDAYFPVEGHGMMKLNGTCALTAHDGWLYVAFRTTSQIIRIPLEEDGSIAPDAQGQLIAQWPTWDPVTQRGSANIYDMEFDTEGRLYVSPGYDGAVYRFTPDPDYVYDATKVDYVPYVDLTELVGAKRSGNICFDDEGSLYICTGQDVTPDEPTRGVIYRIRER